MKYIWTRQANASRWSTVLGMLAALCCLNTARAESASPGQQALAATEQQALAAKGIVIDDSNPEASVPDPEWARSRPLEMGYLVMQLADKAGAAEKAGKHLDAARFYRAIAKAVPDRAVSFGKACRAYQAAGQLAQAAASCREALGKGGVTVEDHLRFVRVTLDLEGALSAEQIEDVEAALKHVETAGTDLSFREAVGYLRCDLALRIERADKLSQCVQELRLLGTSKVRLLPYEWSLSMLKGDTAQAGAMIERASALGLPDSTIAVMQARLDATRPPSLRMPAAAIAAWAAIALLMLSAALFLRQWRRSRVAA